MIFLEKNIKIKRKIQRPLVESKYGILYLRYDP